MASPLQLLAAADGASNDLLLYPSQSSEPPGVTDSKELTIVYEGQKIPEADLYLPHERQKIFDMLKIEILSRRSDISKTLEIPFAPQSIEDLEKLNDLSTEDIKMFLRKKETWLQRLSKVILKLKIPTVVGNKLLNEVNQKIYNSTKAIANSNTKRKSVFITVSAGIALPQFIVQKLKQTSIGRFIPDSGGFFYLFGIGGYLTKKINPETLKKEMVLELFADKQSLIKSTSGILDLSLNLYVGGIQEYREKGATTQKVLITNLGAAGSMRTGLNHTGWTLPFGVGAVPFAGWFLVHDNEGIRKHLGDWNISKTIQGMLDFFWNRETPAVTSCKLLF